MVLAHDSLPAIRQALIIISGSSREGSDALTRTSYTGHNQEKRKTSLAGFRSHWLDVPRLDRYFD